MPFVAAAKCGVGVSVSIKSLQKVFVAKKSITASSGTTRCAESGGTIVSLLYLFAEYEVYLQFTPTIINFDA